MVIALVAVPWPEAMVERGYSRGVFPYVQSALTWLSNRTSWAIIDVGLVVLAMWLVWRIVMAVRHRARLGTGVVLWELTRRMLRVTAAVAVLFYVTWGLNYRRASLEVQLADEAAITASTTATSSALVAAVEQAAREASLLRSVDDERPLTVLPYPVVAQQLEPAFQRALARLELPALSRAGRPKISRVLTPFYTAAGVTGMVNPIALESIVHPDLLPFERPMVLAHEWAHLAGYADEADASAIGWAACISGTPELQYAAHMFFLLEAAGDVPPATWRRIRAGLDPGVIEDFAALATRLTRQTPVVREAAFTVYDQYLKTNQVEDGVRSYGRAVRVLLTPRMRALVTP